MQRNGLTARWTAVAATLLLCLTGLAHAQEFRGTISGAVTDPSGAVIPGAQIVVKEIHTGTVNRTKSDAAGQYVVPFLLPGDYTVTATAQGFETLTHSNITLESQGHPIVNLAMKIGNTGETVTVTAAPPLLDQSNASVGQVITTQSVADLPLNGRTPAVLTELSVGVITTSAPGGITHPFDNNAANAWSIGGTPNQVSEILLDGSPDLTMLGALAYSPTEDSVQEISVRPFDTDASFGHTIGGVINQVTKSGTNSFHGTLYEFSQLSDLDANLYFNGFSNPPKPTPVSHYNQYGGTIGGPVWIPHIFNGRDKLFFFFAYEGLKDSTPAVQITTVPTPAERTGDFSALLAAGCSSAGYTVNASGLATCNSNGAADGYQIYNPFTATLNSSNQVVRQPIPNNNLADANLSINSIAAAYLKLFPQPNATGTATGQDNYVSDAPSFDNYSNQFGRLDYNLSSRDHIFFDFRHNYRTQVKNNYFGNGITGSTLIRENWGSSLDNVFTLNSTTIFDLRLNYTRFNEVHGTPGEAYSPTQLGFPSYMQADSTEVQLPYINFNTGGSCGSFTSYQCLGDTGSALDPTTSYQMFADMVKVIGNHTLKIGFDGRQYRLSVQNFGDSSGSFTFNTNFVTNGSVNTIAIPFGGDLASFELGLPTSGEYDLEARSDYHQYYTGSFIQDDWRVNNKLTLNMGLRFDIDTPFEEKLGRTVNGFNPTATNSASAATAAFKPTTVTNKNGTSVTVSAINALGGLTYPSTHNGAVFATNNGFLSPRFGFSFSPTMKWVFRGGFGIFVQPESLSNLAATGTYSSNAITNSEGFSASTTYVSTSNNYLTSANTLSDPFPGGFVQPSGNSLGASTFIGQSISFLAPVEHDPYAERWDLGFQRSLTNSTMFEAIYVGDHALHLPIESQNLNTTQLQYQTTAPYRNQDLANAAGTTVTNPFKGLEPNSSNCNGSTIALSTLMLKNPQFCSAAVTEENQTIGQSYFESAIVHIEQQAKHGLTLTANYSFSKLIEADTFLNDVDTMPTRRISPFDHTHHFTVGATYELPFGRNKLVSFGGSRIMNEILGGFVVNGIYQFQSGAPIEFSSDIPLNPGVTLRSIKVSPRDTSNVQATAAIPSDSKDVNGPLGPFVTGSTAPTCTSAPDTAVCQGLAFSNDASYSMHYRSLPQTMSWVRADGYNNLDASILKNFNFTERAYLQLRFETFNTLNHPVFAAPNVSSATASNFGEVTAVASNSQPRQVQLGARIVF
ncbi:MAG TPA: TonB-dependent receptor [Candidatus Aquilonibacter sp.]|nr:TonB-dependent receptor [Candidatus Aquilonibacter sp.]